MTTEWSYAGIVEDEGAVLYDINHDGHTFCHKACLIRSYAQTYRPDGRVFAPFDLGTEGMRVGEELVLRRTRSRAPDRHYRLSHRIYKDFRINDLIGSGQRLLGQQSFEFTETSGTPRHETIGVAEAGRFYPSIRFDIPGVSASTQEYIEALRFDYWIEPDIGAGGRRIPSGFQPGIDLVFRAADWLVSEDVAEQTPQQAGLFRDRDGAITSRLVADAVDAVFGSGAPGPGGDVFIGAEKPLTYEVATTGMFNGGRRGWDNIHSWGASNRGLPSTPGLPYGAHLHWRWAAAATNPAATALGDWTPDAWRDPTLAGRTAQGGMVPGGPLIDPRTPSTDLRIAIVKKETAEAFKAYLPDTIREFETSFMSIKRRPDVIEDGDHLVFIISILLRRPRGRRRWRTTVFPHGFFFPHSYDTGYANEAAITLAGAYEPQYLPSRPRRTWIRLPPDN